MNNLKKNVMLAMYNVVRQYAGKAPVEKFEDALLSDLYEKEAQAAIDTISTALLSNEVIENSASFMWKKDYPNGGSVYKTYESIPEHDKQLYRADARRVLTAGVMFLQGNHNGV